MQMHELKNSTNISIVHTKTNISILIIKTITNTISAVVAEPRGQGIS